MKSLITSSCIGLLLLGCFSTALAADEKEKNTATVDPSATQTDIVGSKEAPSVFNIVPWKEKSMDSSQRTVSTSILKETLQPLDREVLRREIQLQHSLSIE
jgi:hypothetical protein